MCEAADPGRQRPAVDVNGSWLLWPNCLAPPGPAGIRTGSEAGLGAEALPIRVSRDGVVTRNKGAREQR